MISPRSPSARNRSFASLVRTQRAGAAGSASPSRSSVRIRPIQVSRNGPRQPSFSEPAPETVWYEPRASSGCGLDGCENRRFRSSWAHGVSKVERKERVAEHRKVRSMLHNVRSMVEIATIFQPTDHAHLARFILPSSVACS
jgi:hypothetical protein